MGGEEERYTLADGDTGRQVGREKEKEAERQRDSEVGRRVVEENLATIKGVGEPSC